MNETEQREYELCQSMPTYFLDHYGNIMLTANGYKAVKIRPEQYEAFNGMINRSNNCYIQHERLSGFSNITSVALMYMLLFGFTDATDKRHPHNISVVTAKSYQIPSIIDGVLRIYQHIPYFMKPGITKRTHNSLEFDNGASIIVCGCSHNALPIINGATITDTFMLDIQYMRQDIIKAFFPFIQAITKSMKKKFVLSQVPAEVLLKYNLLDGNSSKILNMPTIQSI